MSRLSRFLPKFLRGDKSAGQKSGDKSQCKIIFLDETEYFIPYKGGFKGQYVLDKTFEQLNLFEKDYFGLRYIDTSGQTHWLDCNKTLSAQLKGCSVPYTFYFGVKFYPADPCKLKEEITRYQFFLQVKRDILDGRLPVSFEEASELFAYAVQSEIGDFNSQKLPPGYVSEFQFVPNQTDELEDHIAQHHRRLAGTVPATAELKFLDKVKWLDMYGVDLHPVLGESNTEYFLGLTPTGIVVYKNKTKVGNYFWPRITKITFKAKVFIIRVKDKINDEHTYAFELATKPACKHLWKCCVEHHTFFRMNQLIASNSSRTSRPYRSTSQHRNSGRQDRQNNAENMGRDQPRVLRVQSRRQARRAVSDTRLNQGDTVTGLQYNEGHVTMVVTPEHVKGSRHRSLPDLKGRESPTSTRSAPWETNMDTGMYTSGRESPVSVTQSENVNYHRRHRESDSETGYRRKPYRQGYDSDGGTRNKGYQISMSSYDRYSVTRRSGYESDAHSSVHGSIRRRQYFPSSRKGSDNESEVSFTRRRRREIDSGSESDISPNLTARQRKAKSVGADHFEREWQSAMQNIILPGKENRPNGSIPSLHSAPLGESRQKKMRRRRSKSPGNNKRPPEELRQHIEFDLIDPTDEMTEEQLREIPYVNVETKAEAFKVKYSPSNRRRYRSPKRKSAPDLEQGVKAGYTSEEPPPYSHTPERTPEPVHRQTNKPGGYYSDTGSLPKRGQNHQAYPQQYNNTISSHPKHFTADIRSIPQFHENHLFYEPQNSPRYQIHTNPIQRYHPPPTAVFKPIDAITDRNSFTDHRNMNSSQSTSDTKLHDLQGQGELPPESEQGEGHDLTEDRGGDQGLNSSHSSGGTMVNTPPRAGHAHRFGTQDAIARLYSSPSGTRRQNHAGNQSGNNEMTNQNMQYNRNHGQSNQNMGWNNQTPPTRSHHGKPQTFQGYDNNSNVVKTVTSNNNTASFPNQTDTGYQRAQQRMYSGLENKGTIPQSHHNGMVNHSVSQNSQIPANRMFYSQSDNLTNNHPESRTSNTSSYTSDNSYAMKSHRYGTTMQGVNDSDANSYPQNSSYNQSYSQSQNYGTQSAADSRLGLQPSWQYVANGRVPGSNRTPNTEHRQRGGHRTGSRSPNARSPATTPTKSNRQLEMSPHKGTRPLSTNSSSSVNKNSVPPSSYRSPDSAISSITSLSLNNNNANRSPNKLISSSGNNSLSEHVSRVRTPAFGRSDIWTEL